MLDYFVELSRSGGDLVEYRAGRTPAFLVVHPDLVRIVLDRKEAVFAQPPHPFRSLAPCLNL